MAFKALSTTAFRAAVRPQPTLLRPLTTSVPDSNNLSKSDLARLYAARNSVTIVEAEKRIQGTLDLLAEQLIGGKKVTLLNFGVFSVKDVAARVGRNPSTGEALAVPAKKSPRFAFSKKFKDAINAKK